MNNDLVMAYVDGELDSAQAAQFEAQLAADPALQRAVQRERDLRMALTAAYDPVLAEPVPPSLRAVLAAPTPAQVLSLDGARAARAGAQAQPSVRPGWRWRDWGAMAASLVLGLTLGLSGPWRATDAVPAMARSASGALVAQGMLDAQLNAGLAREPAAGVELGLSFAARDPRYGYCRSFVLQGDDATTAGLACRGAEGWVVQALAPAAAAQSQGGYRTAATALPPALLQLVDQMRAADPLDAEGERAARDVGWRR